MKPLTPLAVATLLLMPNTAGAEERLLLASDPAVSLAGALGKQVYVRFAADFAAEYLPRADFEALTVSDLPEGKVCFFGSEMGLDAASPRLAGFVRKDEGDICLSRADVSFRVTAQDTPGAPPVPFYATDAKGCDWAWKTGQGIGLWTEACSFETGLWAVDYDAANDWFALSVNGTDPYPVVRHWRKAGGPEALLPDLKAKDLVLNDPECVFASTTDMIAPPGWTALEVMPVGKLKAAFESQPTDEVPEPPCGELGMAVDYIGFFMVHKDHPDRVVYVNLGQDGTMIDIGSLTLTP